MRSPGVPTRRRATGLRIERRVLARMGPWGAVPPLVVVAGIHGNEPAGVLAAEAVCERLRAERIELRGPLLVLAGNLRALRRGVRFVDRDLNRGWQRDVLARLARGGPLLAAEDREQAELLEEIRRVLHKSSGQRVRFVDLHSTSGDGPPFVLLSDTLRNRRLARGLPIPRVLGIEERIDGALLSWLDDLGHAAVVVEGGANDAPHTVARLESALWILLADSGIVDESRIPNLDLHRRRLREAARGLPSVVEVVHRHPVEPGDGFRMLPGFRSFSRVRRGQPLAEDRRGVIRAPDDGYLLMPLYQPQGEDGFFLAHPVRPFWLRLSAVLRAVRFHALLPLLPGVRRHPEDADALVADRRVARWFVAEVFHLLGYRRVRRDGNLLLFRRRRPDHLPPLPSDRIESGP